MKVSTTFSIDVKDLLAFQERLETLKMKKSTVLVQLISMWMEATGENQNGAPADEKMKSLISEYMSSEPPDK